MAMPPDGGGPEPPQEPHSRPMEGLPKPPISPRQRELQSRGTGTPAAPEAPDTPAGPPAADVPAGPPAPDDQHGPEDPEHSERSDHEEVDMSATTLARPPVSTAARMLLERSRAGLLQALDARSRGERYVPSHRAALRPAAAVLAVRNRPG